MTSCIKCNKWVNTTGYYGVCCLYGFSCRYNHFCADYDGQEKLFVEILNVNDNKFRISSKYSLSILQCPDNKDNSIIEGFLSQLVGESWDEIERAD